MGLVGTGRRSGCGYGGCLLLTVKKKRLCAFATVLVKFSSSVFFFWLQLCGHRLGMRLVFVVIAGFGWIFEFGFLGGFGSLFFFPTNLEFWRFIQLCLYLVGYE